MTDARSTHSSEAAAPAPRPDRPSPPSEPSRWQPSRVACGRIGLGFLAHVALMWIVFVIDDRTRPYSGGWITFTPGEMTLIWTVIVAGPAALVLGALALVSAAPPQHRHRRAATTYVSFLALALAGLVPVVFLLWP
jgi:hypothetical protein